MGAFWSKSLLTPGFAEQRSADGQQDRHGAEEEEPTAKTGGARNGPDQRRTDQKPEVAEDSYGRERRASPALAAEAPGDAEEGRRRQRQPRAGDDEAEERHERVVCRHGDDHPRRRGDPREQHSRRD